MDLDAAFHPDHYHRPVYWNVDPGDLWIMYLSLGVALGAAAWGLVRRAGYWRRGPSPGRPLRRWGTRLAHALRETFLQRGTLRAWKPGLAHALVFYGFLVLFAATSAIFVQEQTGLPVFENLWYKLLSLGSDLGGLLGLVAIGWFWHRRFVAGRPHLDRGLDDRVVLLLLGAILITGLVLEGVRIRYTGEPLWGWSPVGAGLAVLFTPLGPDGGRLLHGVLWWGHMVLAMGFIAAIPFTKYVHLLTVPANVALTDPDRDPALRREDLEAVMAREDFDEEAFQAGIGDVRHVDWKERLDQDACMGCGRCQDRCPATRAGNPFGPKDFILALRQYGHHPVRDGAVVPVVGIAFGEDYVWYCRVCRACVEVCPAYIDHVDGFMMIRRHETLMLGRLPDALTTPLRQLESDGATFGPAASRSAFFSEAGFPVVAPGDAVEVLYFVGCLTAQDATKQRIARDVAWLLDRAGVTWGVLGKDETCCGDPARLAGNELLFQLRARACAEAIGARRFRTLLVSCPHGANVFAHEYPTLGHRFPVMHHTRFLADMVRAGRLVPQAPPGGRVALHDPCYLSRFLKRPEDARDLLQSLPGVELTELVEAGPTSLCCGAGGGHFWMDVPAPRRVNNLRLQQVLDAGARTVATACPFCMGMLVDARANLDVAEKVEVADVATLLRRAVERG